MTDVSKDIVLRLRVGTDDWNRVMYAAKAFNVQPTKAARILLRWAVESLIRYRLRREND